jgi:hypothetical protein
MSARAFSIEGFPPGLWRIDYFGRIARNSRVPSERTIALGISPIIDLDMDPLSNQAVDPSKQRIIHRGTGELPYLGIGTVWRDGDPALITRLPKSDTVSVIASNAQVLDANALVPDPWGNNEELLPARAFRFGPRLYSQAIQHKLVALPSKGGSDPYEIIIPALELMRFYLCTHTLLARALFFGEWRDLIWVAGTHEMTDGSIEVGLRNVRGYTYNAAFVLGRYLKSVEMQDMVHHVFQAMQLADRNNQEPRIGCTFPFKDETDLQVTFKWIPFEKVVNGKKEVRYRRFVTQITSCTHPFPFKECFPSPEVNPLKGENADSPDLKEMEFPPGRKVVPAEPEGGEGLLEHPTEPSGDVESSKLFLNQGRFAALNGKVLRLLPKKLQKYRSKKVLPILERVADGVGTGEGRHGDSDTNPGDILTGGATRLVPVELQDFLAALNQLSTIPDANYVVKCFAPTTDDVLQVGPAVAFPLLAVARTELGRKLKRRIRWLHLSSVPHDPRRIVVAQVSSSKGFAYLFELERKKSRNKKGVTIEESFSVLGCKNLNGSTLGEKDLRMLLKAIAWCHGWPTNPTKEEKEEVDVDLSSFMFLTMTHHRSGKPKEFAERLHAGLIIPLLN